MEQVLIILIAIVIGVAILILGGLLSGRINLVVRRFVPGFWYEGESFLFWGVFLWTTFAMGAYLFYLVTH